MNESIYHDQAILGNPECADGYIRLVRIDRERWITLEWSSFYVWVMLQNHVENFFVDHNGHAVAELSENDITTLRSRTEIVREDHDELILAAFIGALIPRTALLRWKKQLPKREK
jgi:hypothetical protein